MRTQTISRTLAAANSANICASQTPVGAGALVLNGQLNNVFLSQTPGAGAGLFTINGLYAFSGTVRFAPGTAYPVQFNSGGNFSAASISVIGTGIGGLAQTETITGPNAATVTTTKSFQSVSAIQYSASPGAVAVTAFVAQPQLDVQRQVLVSCAGADAARTFVITGTDKNGNVVTESVAGSSGSSTPTVNSYLTITSVTVDAATAGAVTVGTNGIGQSEPVVVDQYTDPHNLRVQFELVSGAVNATVEYTNDDVFNQLPAALQWIAIAGLTSKAATTDDQSLIAPVTAVRLKTNSGTGVGKLIVKQPGIGGL